MAERKLERERRRQDAALGGEDAQSIVLPSGSPQQESPIHVGRHVLLDRMAMGGISDLERQRCLQTDPFMSDEIRSVLSRQQAASAAVPAPAAAPLESLSLPPCGNFPQAASATHHEQSHAEEHGHGKTHFPNLWQGRSPLEKLLGKFGQLLKALAGFPAQQGPGKGAQA